MTEGDEYVAENLNVLYNDVQEFNNSCVNGNLLIFHQDIRSFNKNYDCFSVFVNSINRTPTQGDWWPTATTLP